MLKEPSFSITIELPATLFNILEQTARLTHQPIAVLAQQSIIGNLPPMVSNNLPAGLQTDLLAMQQWSIDQLLATAHSQLPHDQQHRHLALLEKQQETPLTPAEHQELANLRLSADWLMVRKAYAWAVLRWRGHRIPALTDIPLS